MEMKNNIEIKISTTTMRNTGCISCFLKSFSSCLSNTFFFIFLLSCIFIFNLSYGLNQAEGAVRTSTATGGVWANGSTWVGGVAPASGDDAVIATTGSNSVTVGATASIANLTINSGSILNIGGFNFTVTGTTAVNGTLNHSSAAGTKTFNGLVTINNGGTWNNSGNSAITLRGGITNNGTFNAGSGIYTVERSAPLGLVGYWPFNESAGTVAGTTADKSGNSNDITLTNFSSPYGIVSSGKYGNGLSLNGTSNYAKRDVLTNIPTGSVMTVEAWIKPTGTYADANYNGIVSWGSRTCTGTSILTSIRNTGTLGMATWCNDFVPGTGAVATPNQWNHIAVVLNGTSVTLYMNNQPVSGTITAPNIVATKLAVGVTDYPGRYFNGDIDEVRIYNRALSPSEIASAYNNDASVLSGTNPLSIPNLTVAAGAQLINNTSAGLTISSALSGTGTFLQGTDAILNIGGTADITTLDASTNAGNTVKYNNSTADQTVKAATYYNLSITKPGYTAMLGGETTVNGNLTVTSGTFDPAGYNLTLNGDLINNGNMSNISARNVVNNPGFETGNWGGPEVQTSADKYSGAYSAQLTASGVSIFSHSSNQIPVSNVAGKTFTVSAQVNATITTGNLYLRIRYYNSSNAYISHKDWQIFNTSTAGWQNFSKTIDPSNYLHPDTIAGTAYIYVDFGWWNASNNPTGTAYVDNFSLIPNSQIIFSGSSAQSISGNAIGIETLTVNNSAGVTNNITTGGLTVTNALSGTGTLLQGTNAILNIGGTSGIATLDASTNAGNTVNYSSTSAQTVQTISYSNLTLSGGGVKSIATGTSVGGDLSIAPTGSATASIGTGLNIIVESLSLGGLGRNSGTWGSTSSTATNQDDTYFAATTGYLTVSTDTRTTPSVTIWPSASVIIYGQALSDSTLSGGSASVPGSFAFTTPSTTPDSAGTYSASVTFTPTDLINYKPVTENVDVAVAKASTETTVGTHTPDPSGFNQTITVNYSVAVTAPGTATGNVTVSAGADTCTGTVAAGSCLLTLTSLGSKNLTAVYEGDTNFDGSTSPSVSHTVIPTTTTTIVTHTPDPTVVGQTVTVNYTVAVDAPGVGTPTGNVTVSAGADTCTGTVAAGSCSLTLTSTGTKSIAAVYSGDANFYSSTSTSVSHTVNKASTATTIVTHTPAPSTVGQTVTITYTVAVNAPGAGTPTGNVTISDGTASCAASIAVGTCTLKPTSAGSKTLTATYAGNENYNTSTSAGVSHTVDKADQAISFNALPVMNVGDPDLDPGAIASSGLTVSYASSDPSVATIVSGKIHIIAVGSSTITASQAGDGNYNAAAPVQQTLDVSATPHPSEPSDISLSSMRSGGPIISWGTVVDAVTYKIYRSTNNVTWTLIMSVPHPISSFRDTTAPRSNTTYYWTVTAENANGESTKPAGVAGRTALLSGWNMISAPVDTAGAGATLVYGPWAYWTWTWISEGNYDPDYNGYWQDDPEIVPGTSQFVWVNNSSTEVDASGSANPAAVTVTLLPGWTMIANHTPGDLTDIKTYWLIDGSPLSAAITGSIIGGDIYWWNGSTYDSMNITLDDPSVEPWKGYWILNMDSVSHTLTIQ